MKELYIIRHGKSSWEMEYVEDIDRPLTERGVRNANTMGRRLFERDQVPDLIYSSPANRALHTAVIMARAMKVPESDIRIKYDLYMPDFEDIEKVIQETPDSISRLAIIGHNPSFTEFANRYLKEKLDNIPTAGLVILTFDAKAWKEVLSGEVIKEFIDCPKKKW